MFLARPLSYCTCHSSTVYVQFARNEINAFHCVFHVGYVTKSEMFRSVLIIDVSIYIVLMLSTSLQMITIDQNISEF